MGIITLSFSNNSNKQNKNTSSKNKQKVQLTYHNCIMPVDEYFSYMTNDNEEVKFTDKSYMITKISSTKYVAKKSFVSKIPLTYVPGQNPIEYKPESFTYNGNEIYLDKPIYDQASNRYKGTLEIINISDKEIKLYEEE